MGIDFLSGEGDQPKLVGSTEKPAARKVEIPTSKAEPVADKVEVEEAEAEVVEETKAEEPAKEAPTKSDDDEDFPEW